MKQMITLFHTFLKTKSIMLTLVLLMFSEYIFAQNCGFSNSDGCPNTNYANYGLYSNNDASTIEYDNVVGSDYSAAVRTPEGKWMIWGKAMANDGLTNLLVPTEINNTNFPAIGSSKPLKVLIVGESSPQVLLLTSDGLYAWGEPGRAVSTTVKGNNYCSKLPPIANNPYSLPPGVTPKDVKMLTGSTNFLMLLTCDGYVWTMLLSYGAGSDVWTQVTTDQPSNPALSNIIASRCSAWGNIALSSDGSLWAWGGLVYKGDGSDGIWNSPRAIKINSPTATIKMIGTTGGFLGTDGTYFVLGKDGKLFSLGGNYSGSVGSWDNVERKTWIQPRYGHPSGPLMNDIQWINTPNGADKSGILVLNKLGNVYGWGGPYTTSVGYTKMRTITPNIYTPQMPGGLTQYDSFYTAVTIGEVNFVFGCNSNFGIFGYPAYGVVGNGVNDITMLDFRQFVSYTTAPLSVCGQDKLNNVCISAVPGVGTIECLKTQISPVPVSGSSSRVTLRIQLNIISSGSFPLSVSGSGLSLVNGFSSITASNTGLQYFDIPLNYDGTALGTLNFTVGNAGSCTADLLGVSKKKAIVDLWTLDCIPVVGPSLK